MAADADELRQLRRAYFEYALAPDRPETRLPAFALIALEAAFASPEFLGMTPKAVVEELGRRAENRIRKNAKGDGPLGGMG